MSDFTTEKFSAVFRLKSGVMSSLNVFKMTDEKSPVLQPYPSYENNEAPLEPSESLTKDDPRVFSAVRISVDECNRLWVLDCGADEMLGLTFQMMPSSVLIFDLNTDKLVRRFVIPNDQKKPESSFANIVRNSSHTATL